ncbi:MAG: hypothetical protein ACR2NP_05525 [Pirellulaceae bacterium]
MLCDASSPQLNSIMPRGVQRGHEHVLTFSGARLDKTQEVFLYSEGVTVTNIEQVDAANVRVTISVAADCRLGEHVAQLRTTSGISEFRSFFVGELPAVAEAEPNNEFETPQELEHNVTVAGTLTPEDIDYFRIQATRDQRISIEIEAIRLGTFLVDPYIAILDEKQFEILAQDDTELLKQDCFVSFVAPEDGTYTVLVRDAAYGGNANAHYRMHIGNFPRPVVVFPAGGKPGTEMDVTFIGDPAGPIESQITTPAETAYRNGLFYNDEFGITPSPVAFRLAELDNVFEVEPNASMNEPTSVPVPCAVNGVLSEEGDHDWFSFTGKKDQVFDFEVFARRVNSPADAVFNIWGTDKKYIGGNDDSRGPDAYQRFTLPADGEYYFRVRDLLNRGGENFVYRVEISTPKRQVAYTIPRVGRYTQYRQSIFVPQGNRFATLIAATRQNFGGELKLLEDNLPAGVTMQQMPMAGNLNVMPVVFEAAPDAEISGALADLMVSHVDDAQNLTGHYANTGMFVLGPPNNTQYVGCRVDKLPIAVIKPLPFRLEIVQPTAPLVREGSINIRVIAHRDEGFTAPITLQFPFRPPGVGTTGSVTIPEGQTEVVYPLNANANAQIRKWPMYVIGNADVSGNAWASSQLATLDVAERFVTVEMQRAGCEQGAETQFVCKVNQLAEFDGTATAELLGVPPHTEVPRLEFDKTTSELVFTVQTKSETPAGKHTGVFCRVTIPMGDESVVATAGRSELQVDVPLPTEQAEPAATPPQSEPAARPLSRLEKLREAARKQKGGQQ